MLTTVESIQTTLREDPHTFRWFLHLVCQETGRGKSVAKILPAWSSVQALTSGLSLIGLLTANYFFVLLSLAAGFFLMMKLQNTLFPKLASAVKDMVSADFKQEEIAAMTLYQISEHYAGRYKIASLPDVIAAYDRTLQVTVLSAILLSFYFQIFHPFHFITIGVFSWWAARAILDSGFVYGRLK